MGCANYIHFLFANQKSDLKGLENMLRDENQWIQLKQW